MLGVVLDIFQHVGHGFAVDGLVDAVAVAVDGDVYGIGVAEEVVHVAENFLIGSYEEDGDIVLFALSQGVQRDVVGLVVVVDVCPDFTVRVAGNVLECGTLCGFFLQSLYRHDGEKLVECPMVGQTLEETEVAEVFFSHRLVEFPQLIGAVFLVVCQFADFVADAPVERFYLCAGLEVEESVSEQVEGLFADILCVVPVLEHGACGSLVPDVVEFVHQFVVALCRHEVFGHMRHPDRFEDFEDEYGMVCGEGASALGDDVGVGYSVFVRRLGKGVDDVVDILLYAVVDRRFGVAAACPVIVHAQSASAVDEFDAEVHFPQLHIVLCHFAQCDADGTDFGDLAADVEVYEFEAVAESEVFELVESLEEFGAVESEL